MKLKAWQIILIVLVFGTVFMFAARAGSEWRKYQGPDMMRVSLAGDLYIQALDKIFVYSADGIYDKTIDLAPWGIRQSTGGFDVFSNGDLLLLEGSHDQGPLLQLLTFLRMEKLLQSDEPATGASATEGRRLVRCSPVSGECAPLPNFTRTFESTFRVQIDHEDRIFLADTSRDSLAWLAEDGTPLDSISSGFRFPNQIALEGDALLVANTNHNEITRIPLVDGHFAPQDQWHHLPVNGDVASRTGHVWPVEMVTVDDERFVMQMDTNMAQGVVFRYDTDGLYQGRFTMPEGSDALSLVYFRDQLLVADPRNLCVWRYDTAGNADGQYASVELETFLQSLAQQRAHYQQVEKRWWWAFGGLLVAGFVLAIIGEQRAKRLQTEQAVEAAHATLAVIAQQGDSPQPAADDPDIHWLARNDRRVRMIRLVVWLCAGLLLLMMVLTVARLYSADDTAFQDGKLSQFMTMQGVLVAALVFVCWSVEMLIKRVRIGVLREWVILRNLSGKTAVGRGADIQLFPNAIAIERVMVNIGRRTAGELPTHSLFDLIEMQQWLAPRLLQGQELTGMAVLGWYCRQQPVQTVLTVLAVVGLVVLRFT